MPTEKKNKPNSWPVGFAGAWHSYLSNCRRKNIFFELSREEFHKLVQKNCIYCAKPPSNNCHGYKYNGLDRKDNRRGYTPDNVVPCCNRCNSVKGDWLTFEEMKRAMKAIQRKKK